MSALVANDVGKSERRWSRCEPTWCLIETRAPEMVTTMRRYLTQLGELLKPRSVEAAEVVLRQFAGRVTEADDSCLSVAAIRRHHVEDYLAWLRARPGQQWGSTVSPVTVGHRLGLLAKFFDRLVEWDYLDRAGETPGQAR